MMHQNKPDVQQLACQVIEAFARYGISVQAEPWLSSSLHLQRESLFSDEESKPQAVISVGGDGTILRANQQAVQMGLPLLGINVGRVGFLAEVEMHQLDMACQRLQRDEYTLESRMMLQADIENGLSVTALNDVVISRGGYARLIAVKAWVDGELVGRYVGDGLIVSTPTGSTGYSLSAGGPIIYPEVECLVLSPICAHSLQHRPVVISSNQNVVLGVDCDANQLAQLSLDGQEIMLLQGRQRVSLRRADAQARFIRLSNSAFFNIIRNKLSEWSC